MNSPAKSTVFPPDIVKSVPDNVSDCESLSRLVVSVKSDTSAGIVGLLAKLL